MYGKSSILIMGWYKNYRESYPVFSFVSLFLVVAFIMFVFFTIQLLRPWSRVYERMNNTEVSWAEIRKKVEKVNYGETPKQVVLKMGEPDFVFTSGDIVVYSYQKYGAYKPVFQYDVEFRADTLFRITTPNDFK